MLHAARGNRTRLRRVTAGAALAVTVAAGGVAADGALAPAAPAAQAAAVPSASPPRAILKATALRTTALTAAAPALLPQTITADPAGNVPENPDFSQVCYSQGGSSAACTSAALQAIDNARAAEHVRAMALPRNFAALSVSQQLFVVADLERVDRGLTSLAGMTAQLDSYAQQGANGNTDPSLPSWTLANGDSASRYVSNWAGDYSALASDYDWMYNDGWGGQNATSNVDCTSPSASGCWGHRHNVLYPLSGPLLLAGAGSVHGGAGGPLDSDAELFVSASGPTPAYTYSWAQARAAGADSTAAPAAAVPAARPAPTVSAMSLTSDYTTGGATATVSGTGFALGATTVAVTPAGGRPETASVLVASASQLIFTVPPLPAGSSAAVALTTSGGSVAAGRLTARTTGSAGASATGGWQPLTPYRLADTRLGSGQPAAGRVLQPGQSLDVAVAGTSPAGGGAGVPTGAASVALNVTAISPAGPGYLAVYPTGTSRPDGSNVNFSQGRTVGNLTHVPVGAGGEVSVYNGSGQPVQVAVDVEGYTAGSTSGSFTAMAPARIADTRSGSGQQGAGQPVSASRPLRVQVAGVAGVPRSATAVLLNLVSVQPAGGGYLVAYPDGAVQPLASDVNAVPHQTVAATVLVPLGSDGAVQIGGGGASAQVVVTAEGWLAAGVLTSGVTAVSPTRIADTRAASGQADAGAPLRPGSDVTLAVTGGHSPVPVGATAVVLDVAAVVPSGPGYLEVYPAGAARPLGSDLNYLPGQDSSVLVVVPIGPGGVVRLYSPAGTVNVVVDVEGWIG